MIEYDRVSSGLEIEGCNGMGMGRDGAKVVVVPARPVPTLSALLYLAISARQIDAARRI